MSRIEDKVCEKIQARSDVGKAKYGTDMERTDLTNLEWLNHLQEELMDGAVYVEKIRERLVELMNSWLIYGADMDGVYCQIVQLPPDATPSPLNYLFGDDNQVLWDDNDTRFEVRNIESLDNAVGTLTNKHGDDIEDCITRNEDGSWEIYEGHGVRCSSQKLSSLLG